MGIALDPIFAITLVVRDACTVVHPGAQPAHSDDQCRAVVTRFMTQHIFNVTNSAESQTLLPVPNVKFTNIDLATAAIYDECLWWERMIAEYNGTHL